MKVKEIMTRVVVTVDHGEKVLEAARLMRNRGVGSLVVMKEGSPTGIVTERDLVRKILAEGIEPNKVAVKDVMSKILITVELDEDLSEAAKKMARNNIRRLPVVGEGGRLAGIITATDLAKSLAGRSIDDDILMAAISRFYEL